VFNIRRTKPVVQKYPLFKRWPKRTYAAYETSQFRWSYDEM